MNQGVFGPDAAQQPVGRVGKPEDIAEMALFLCSDKIGSITGETSASTAAQRAHDLPFLNALERNALTIHKSESGWIDRQYP